MKTIETDFLIIGSGIAGLMTALKLSDRGQVLIATKDEASQSNTSRAQGGISCVIDSEDSFEAHIQDTLDAGAGLCRKETVERIIRAAPEGIRELESLGVNFEKQVENNSFYDLGKEGGHRHRRVLHVGDFTGESIIHKLLKKVVEHPNLELYENFMAIDLVTSAWLGHAGESRCVGAYFLEKKTREILAVRARHTILATGGLGKVYLYTSNPDIATGDGIAMAWRAGVPVVNMEFVQFHPTCLYHPEAKSFLISEAVRGEGGELINPQGKSFAQLYDQRGSLAPRDIVARAIDHEMKSSGDSCVYLDITHKSKNFLMKRFPTIFENCKTLGFDMSEKPIPVVPAAHYACGGIQVDDFGQTCITGLHAAGESACTGLHGANRLASNSLLEAMVCSSILAENIKKIPAPEFNIPDWQIHHAVPSDEEVVVEHNWDEVRTCMWDYVGIVRTDKRLERALHRIQNLRYEIREYYMDYLVTSDTLELRNIADVAELIIRSAKLRRESRGLHFTLDYPEKLPQGRDTIISGR